MRPAAACAEQAPLLAPWASSGKRLRTVRSRLDEPPAGRHAGLPLRSVPPSLGPAPSGSAQDAGRAPLCHRSVEPDARVVRGAASMTVTGTRQTPEADARSES